MRKNIEDKTFHLSISKIAKSKDYLIDDDIAIIENMDAFSSEMYGRLDVIVILVCMEGKLQLDINSKTYLIQPNDLLVCSPNFIVGHYMTTPNFKGRILLLTNKAIQELLHEERDMWNKIFYVNQNPIIHLGKEDIDTFNVYYSLISYKLGNGQKGYHKKVMKSVVQAILYELLTVLENFSTSSDEKIVKQGDILFRKFLQLLDCDEVKVRSVAHYANRLFVTPKYLSLVCRNISGDTASKWINNRVMEDIKRLLLHSSKSIKEISEYLDFPNISFFGKFVKNHLGMSPTDYRKQIKKEDILLS